MKTTLILYKIPILNATLSIFHYNNIQQTLIINRNVPFFALSFLNSVKLLTKE